MVDFPTFEIKTTPKQINVIDTSFVNPQEYEMENPQIPDLTPDPPTFELDMKT